MWTAAAQSSSFDETTRMLRTPFAMSLCRFDYSSLKLQAATLANHAYNPTTFEGILEQRKEKSRDAARSRRGKENYEFYELAKLLPLPSAITSQLDKASIVRLTISYLKLREFSANGQPSWSCSDRPLTKSLKSGCSSPRSMSSLVQDVFESHHGTHLLQSIDGFVFILSDDGRFLYISETVSIYLGLSQVEMTGSSIFDYIHRQDHQELSEQLGLLSKQKNLMPCSMSPASKVESDDDGGGGGVDDGGGREGASSAKGSLRRERHFIKTSDRNGSADLNSRNDESDAFSRCFCIRMKSTLTKRGLHIKSSGYRVVQIAANSRRPLDDRMRTNLSGQRTDQQHQQEQQVLGVTAVAIALPSPTTTELIIDKDAFVTRLSPTLVVTFCESRVSELIDLKSEDILHLSFYDLCHADDMTKLRRAHVDLLNKGQSMTDYYRLMTGRGGYVWIQTVASVICNSKNIDEMNIVAINYVISCVEHEARQMTMHQFSANVEAERIMNSGSRMATGDLLSSINKATLTASCDDYANAQPHFARTGRGAQAKRTFRRKSDKPRKRKRNHEASLTILEHSPQERPTGDAYETTPSYLSVESEKPAEERFQEKIPEKAGAEQRKKFKATDEVTVDRPPCLRRPIPPTCPHFQKLGSPIPEDLTVRTYPLDRVEALDVAAASVLSMQGNRKSDDDCSMTTTIHQRKSEHEVTWLVGISQNPTASSVQDLEEAMNKHLPAKPEDDEVVHFRCGGHSSSSSSASSISKSPCHRRAIQWIGSDYYSGLPASTLLRSLYANRESVIRTNMTSPRAAQYYPESQAASLLTRPCGAVSRGYNESSYISSCKTPPSNNGVYGQVVSGYVPSSPVGIHMHQNMPPDAYVTPPASVSPHTKYPSQYISPIPIEVASSQKYDVTSMVSLKSSVYPSPGAYLSCQQHPFDVTSPYYSSYTHNTPGFSG